ncbi:MAG: GIY-YIG nuclease family protein [Ignavibacteria bacterium]|nr:GIY-YIG nuclease family protein [Ignavibacteria bacterium]
MIYFIKANDKIKIGYADDPSKRIPSIQTSSPFDLEVLLIIDGNYDKESELHKRFHGHRTSGEWFNYEESIKAFIKENLEYDRKYEFGFIIEDFAGNEQVLRLRKQHRLSLQALGEKLNITAQSVKEIQDREKTGSATIKILENIAEVLGYKFEYRFLPKTKSEDT